MAQLFKCDYPGCSATSHQRERIGSVIYDLCDAHFEEKLGWVSKAYGGTKIVEPRRPTGGWFPDGSPFNSFLVALALCVAVAPAHAWERITQLRTVGPATGVALDAPRQFAPVTSYGPGLSILRVSDPWRPQITDQDDLGFSGYAVAVNDINEVVAAIASPGRVLVYYLSDAGILSDPMPIPVAGTVAYVAADRQRAYALVIKSGNPPTASLQAWLLESGGDPLALQLGSVGNADMVLCGTSLYLARAPGVARIDVLHPLTWQINAESLALGLTYRVACACDTDKCEHPDVWVSTATEVIRLDGFTLREPASGSRFSADARLDLDVRNGLIYTNGPSTIGGAYGTLAVYNYSGAMLDIGNAWTAWKAVGLGPHELLAVSQITAASDPNRGGAYAIGNRSFPPGPTATATRTETTQATRTVTPTATPSNAIPSTATPTVQRWCCQSCGPC